MFYYLNQIIESNLRINYLSCNANQNHTILYKNPFRVTKCIILRNKALFSLMPDSTYYLIFHLAEFVNLLKDYLTKM